MARGDGEQGLGSLGSEGRNLRNGWGLLLKKRCSEVGGGAGGRTRTWEIFRVKGCTRCKKGGGGGLGLGRRRCRGIPEKFREEVFDGHLRRCGRGGSEGRKGGGLGCGSGRGFQERVVEGHPRGFQKGVGGGVNGGGFSGRSGGDGEGKTEDGG